MNSKKISFIIHGKTHRITKLTAKITAVFRDEYSLQFLITESYRHSEHLVQEALSAGTDYLIALGGDGTLNEVVNGLLRVDTDKQIVMGLLPYGTGNDFARTIGADRELHKLYNAIKANSLLLTDVGQINFTSFEGKAAQRYFINIADVGMGGMVSEMVNHSSRTWGANLIYFSSILKAFAKYKHQTIRLEAADLSWEGKVLSLCMANGRYFGSGLCIAPEADIADGVAELVLIGDVSIWDYLKNLINLKKGRKIKHPEVSYHKTDFCKIETQVPCPIDMDGEFVGYTPLQLTWHKQAVVF